MKRKLWFITNAKGTKVWNWDYATWSTDWGYYCAFTNRSNATEALRNENLKDAIVVQATLTFLPAKPTKGA